MGSGGSLTGLLDHRGTVGSRRLAPARALLVAAGNATTQGGAEQQDSGRAASSLPLPERTPAGRCEAGVLRRPSSSLPQTQPRKRRAANPRHLPPRPAPFDQAAQVRRLAEVLVD